MASVPPANPPQEETDEFESAAVDQAAAAMGGVPPKPVTGEEIAKFFANMMAPPAAAATAASAPAAPIPEKDYRGLKPIEIPNFDGDTSEYHFFKKSFKAAYDYRNLDKTTMALVLKSHLRGQASQYAQNELINEIDDTSYDIIWATLDNRYGGSYNETASITEQFNQLPVMRTMDFVDLDRTYHSFKVQKNYYVKYEPETLENEMSMLNTLAKSKLTVPLGSKYIRWCQEKKVLKNFNSLVDWLKFRYEVALESEREYSPVLEAKPKNQEFDGEEESDPEFTYWAEPKDGGPKFRIGKQTILQKKLVRLNDESYQFDDESSGQSFRNETKGEILELRPTDICELCNMFHEMSKCPKFEQLCLTKKKLLMRLFVLCFHCLSSQHLARDCKVDEEITCGIRGCKSFHHPLIHADKKSKSFEFDRNQFTPLSVAEKDSIWHLFGRKNL